MATLFTRADALDPRVSDVIASLPAAPAHRIVVPASSADEAALLREHNRALRAALDTLQPVLPRDQRASLARQLDSVEGTQAFMQRLQRHLDSPEFLASLDARHNASLSDCVLQSRDNSNEVCVVDLDEMEWWTLVPSEKQVDTVDYEADTLGGGFVWVEHDDVVASIADAIADTLKSIPAAQRLDNARLQSMLSSTFGELREKTLSGKLWQWGALAMSTYSWSAYAVSMYRDPSTLFWVMRTLYTTLKYACVLL